MNERSRHKELDQNRLKTQQERKRHRNSSAFICWKELGSEHWDGYLALSLMVPSSRASHDHFLNGKIVGKG